MQKFFRTYFGGIGGLGAQSAWTAEDGGPWVPAWQQRYITMPILIAIAVGIVVWIDASDGDISWLMIAGITAAYLVFQYLIAFPLLDHRRREWEEEQAGS